MELTPRAYQMELFNHAKNGNSVIVLDTGAGKTLISGMVIRHVLDTAHEKKICVFMVPTVPLVIQQADYLGKHMGFRVTHYYGAMGCDQWPYEKWRSKIEKSDVMVMTPMILVDAIQAAFISFTDISLLVFDECHHTRRRHPYAQVINLYRHSAHKPKILGLTASPLNSATEATNSIAVLESNLESKAVTFQKSSEEEVREFASNCNEEILHFDDTELINLKFSGDIKPVTPIWEEYQCQHFVQSIPIVKEQLIPQYNQIERDHGKWVADFYFVSCLRTLKKGYEKSVKNNTCIYFDEESAVIESILQDILPDWMSEIDIKHKALVMELHETLAIAHENAIVAHWPQLMKLAPKVHALVEILVTYLFKEDFRGMIFVETKKMAITLSHILSNHPELKHIRCSYLIGHGASNIYRQSKTNRSSLSPDKITKLDHSSSSSKDSKLQNFGMAITEQKKTVAKFRSGELNLLVCTSVAEEGLDIQPCMLVVRYDSCKTVTTYIQSRGRARHKRSRFVFLVGKNDYETQERIKELRQQEGRMRFALHGKDLEENPMPYGDGISKRLTKQDTYTVASTGATVTTFSSVNCLARYCACLPKDDFINTDPEYRVERCDENLFLVTINLPMMVPESCRFVLGYPRPTKSEAKASAALCAVKKLHYIGELSDRLQPIVKHLEEHTCDLVAEIYQYIDDKNKEKQDDVLKNESETNGNKKSTNFYDLGKPVPFRKPLYSSIVNSPSGAVTVFVHSVQFTIDEDIQPIHFGFLSCDPVVAVDRLQSFSFGIFKNDVTLRVEIKCIKALEMDIEMYNNYLFYHRNICSSFLRHPSLSDIQEWGYIFVPMKCDTPSLSIPITSNTMETNMMPYLDYDSISRCIDLHQQSALSSILNGCVIEPGYLLRDLSYYSRTWILVDVLGYMNPFTNFHDQAVSDYLKGEVQKREGNLDNILKFNHLAGFYKARLRFKEDIIPSQPLFLVQRVPYPNEDSGKLKFDGRPLFSLLLPQSCFLTGFSYDQYVGFLYLPSIMRHAEHDLLARELQKQLNLDRHLDSNVFNIAVTKFSAKLCYNYDTAETLGDSFLKIAQGLHLFANNPSWNEGRLSFHRMQLENNKLFKNIALVLNLDKVIHTGILDRKVWLPTHHENLEGKVQVKRIHKEHVVLGKRRISNKTLADILEAIIGVCVGYEPEAVDDTPEKRGAFALSQILSSKFQYDWPSTYLPMIEVAYKPLHNRFDQTNTIQTVRIIQEKLKYKFKHQGYLIEALTHPSYVTQDWVKNCYQRLEYLGDSLYNYLITRYIIKNYPDLSIHASVEYRTKWVSNRFLSVVCCSWNFHKFIYSGSAVLNYAMSSYAERLKLLRERIGGKSYWNIKSDKIICPKAMADVMEAIFGAMFIDSGLNVRLMENFIRENIIDPWKQYVGEPDNKPNEAVGNLFQMVANKYSCKDFHIQVKDSNESETTSSDNNNPKVKNDNDEQPQQARLFVGEVICHDHSIVKALAKSKKRARTQVSLQAAATIQMDGLPHCDCRKKITSEQEC